MGKKKNILLVDGYNIIHAWSDLKEIAEYSLSTARDKLFGYMSEYSGYTHTEVIIVFDAHMVKDGLLKTEKRNGVTIIYTKEYETADSYIERKVNELVGERRVRVATSDNLEQIIVMGNGAERVSARELKIDITNMKKQIKEEYIDRKPVKNNTLFDNLDLETAALLEKLRLNEYE